MKTLAVFEPAISYFDPVLVQFAANPAVVKEMEAGMDRLPVITVDGHIISNGMYPSRQQLAQALGIAAAPGELAPVKAAACPCMPWI